MTDAHRPDASQAPALRLHGIAKYFGEVCANEDISLDLAQGQILGLLGENGAGKTTLISILFGHYVADRGHIEVFGKPLLPGSQRAAIAAGIGLVHQHFTLAGNLTVLDNVMVGTESLWAPASDSARRRVPSCVRCPNNLACAWTRTRWCSASRWASNNASKF